MHRTVWAEYCALILLYVCENPSAARWLNMQTRVQNPPITLTEIPAKKAFFGEKKLVCKRLVLSFHVAESPFYIFQLTEESQLLFLHLKRMRHTFHHCENMCILSLYHEKSAVRPPEADICVVIRLIHTLSGLSSAGKALPSQMHGPFCPQPMESILLTCCNCLK